MRNYDCLLQLEYNAFLEGAILETGNSWFLDMVQNSIKMVPVLIRVLQRYASYVAIRVPAWVFLKSPTAV